MASNHEAMEIQRDEWYCVGAEQKGLEKGMEVEVQGDRIVWLTSGRIWESG